MIASVIDHLKGLAYKIPSPNNPFEAYYSNGVLFDYFYKVKAEATALEHD